MTLEVTGLSGGYGQMLVVEDLNIRLDAGRVATLTGFNGAGKSTILKGISGVLPVCRGAVRLDDTDLSHASPHQRVVRGLVHVPQGRHVFGSLTVAENLLLGGRCAGVSKAFARERLTEMLETFPVLGTKRHARAASLSGGQQQVLAIARGLMCRPRVLLLDEPSAGLSPLMVGELVGWIRSIAASGVGLLLAEQAIELAEEVSDEILRIEGGHLVSCAPPGKTTWNLV